MLRSHRRPSPRRAAEIFPFIAHSPMFLDATNATGALPRSLQTRSLETITRPAFVWGVSPVVGFHGCGATYPCRWLPDGGFSVSLGWHPEGDPMSWTGIAVLQVSSVMIREVRTEDQKMGRKRRNHLASFKTSLRLLPTQRRVWTVRIPLDCGTPSAIISPDSHARAIYHDSSGPQE